MDTLRTPTLKLARYAQALVETHIPRYQHVYLKFSGGKDSLAVATLCEPWRERVSLTWLNTGYHPAHMMDFVRGHRDQFRLIEITPADDLMDVWRVHGRPAPVPYNENVPFILQTCRRLGRSQHKWMPYEACCSMMKLVPMRDFLANHDSRPLVITGHRRTDVGLTQESFEGFVDGVGPLEHADMLCPILDWTTENVMDFLACEGVELPFQYREGVADSMDECGPCAMSADHHRLAFLDRYYPREAKTVRETEDQWKNDLAG